MSWRPAFAVLASAAVLVGVAVAPQSASAAPAIAVGRVAAPAGGTTAVGAGIDGANQNAQLAERISSTIAPSWRNAPPKCSQAGNVVATSISVTAASTIVVEAQYQCSSVSAYATSTGALQWRQQYGFARSATVVGDKVFVTHEERNAAVPMTDALSVRTGRVVWSKAMGGDPRRAVSVGSGLVATSASVVSAATGRDAFRLSSVMSPGLSIVTGGRVHHADAAGVETKDTKGRTLWSTAFPAGITGPYASSGGPDLAVHAGLLYVTGSKTVVLDVKTGRIARTLPSSATAIAFDGNTGFSTTRSESSGSPLVASTVRAVNLTTGKVLWSHPLPMQRNTAYQVAAAPVVSNGLVWFPQRATSGDPTTLVALDEVTGAQRSETMDTCTDGGTWDGNLVLAQRRVFVSTGCGVQTFLAAKRTPVPPTAGEVLADPGFERGTDGWTPVGDASVTRASSSTHGGSGALVVVPASSGTTIGAQRVVVRNGVRSQGYSVSCWVRPTATGMSAAIRSSEWSGTQPTTVPTGWDVQELTLGVWTRIDWLGHISADGDSAAVQVFAQRVSGGSLLVDDCSTTGR